MKADDRTIAALKKSDASFTPEKYSLAVDPSGAWLMTMAVRGPSAASKHAPASLNALPSFSLFELGGLALPPGPLKVNGQSPHTLALREDVADGGNVRGGSHPMMFGPNLGGACADPAEQFERVYQRPAPKSMDEWFGYEHEGVFDCGSIEASCCGLQLLASLGWPVFGLESMGCVAPRSVGPSSDASAPSSSDPSALGSAAPSASPSSQVIPQVLAADLPAHITYTSDDPSVEGQPAAGAVVRFSMLGSAINGPSEVVADADGKATTFGPLGSFVTLTGYITLGPRSSKSAEATIAMGLAAVELVVEKLNPAIELLIEADKVPVPAKLRVNYMLDNVAAHQDIDVLVPGGQSANARFSMRLPDDAEHHFVLTQVLSPTSDASPARRVDAGAPAASSAPEALVQRNGKYRFAVGLFAPQAK